MSEMPSAFRTVTRRARKHHLCCECGTSIAVGDRYQYSSGIWDGEPSDYKQCMNCHEIINAAARSAEFIEDGPCFGELYEWFESHMCRGFEGIDWVSGMAKKINIEPEKLDKLLRVGS